MLFKAFNLVIDSDFDLGLPTISTPFIDFYFKRYQLEEVKSVKTNIYRKGIQAKVSKINEKISIHWENIGSFEANNGQILYYHQQEKENTVFRLFAISEALGLILQQKGYFLLHGSAVKVGSKAYVFIGTPGAGKSTTIAAFAKMGHTVLSDDMTAISFDKNGSPIVLPAYPEIKIWEDSVHTLGFDKELLEPAYEGHNKYILRQNEALFPSDGVPLEQIIILQKPYSKKTKELKLNEIPIELLKYYPLPQQILRGEFLEKHFIDSLKIATHVSVNRINRPKNYCKLFDFIHTFQ